MLSKKLIHIGVLLYILLFAYLLSLRLAESPELTFSSDAAEYNAGAVHLVREWFYSLDGVTPYIEREPGMSAFLAVIYFFFGVENRLAVFAVQGILYLVAVVHFVRLLGRNTTTRVAHVAYFFLLFSPAVYHAQLSLYREGFALSLSLLFASAFLKLLRENSHGAAVVAGLLLGALILTYVPFLLFPLFLTPLSFIFRDRSREIVLVIVVSFALVFLWAMRNEMHDGRFRVVGNFRTTAMLYARGEQAEDLKGLQPFRCLLAEYVTRDWSLLPPSCSTNYLINTRWPGRKPTGEETAIAHDSVRKIFSLFPSYLRFSLFEVLELHLPHVNGWGMAYNILTTAMTVVLYVGCAAAYRTVWRKEYALFLLFILYATVMFALTDATPRYLVPAFLAYATLASIGYSAFLPWLPFPSSSRPTMKRKA